MLALPEYVPVPVGLTEALDVASVAVEAAGRVDMEEDAFEADEEAAVDDDDDEDDPEAPLELMLN